MLRKPDKQALTITSASRWSWLGSKSYWRERTRREATPRDEPRGGAAARRLCRDPALGGRAADAADDPRDRGDADREGDREDRKSAGVSGGGAVVLDQREPRGFADDGAGEEGGGGGGGGDGEAGAVGAVRGPSPAEGRGD